MMSSRLGATLGCWLAVMAACSPNDPSTGDAGSRSSKSLDGGGIRDASIDTGTCSVALAAIFLGSECATCVESNCQALLASCTADNCTQCLLGCNTCLSACTDPGPSAEGDSGVPLSGDGGARPSGDGGVPSCDKIRNGNCCAYAAAASASLEAQCQQAVAANSEAICAKLLSRTQNFLGYCK